MERAAGVRRPWDAPGFSTLRELGSGGFGDVVLARQDASGALVAIKYLHHDLLEDLESARMFRVEAAVLATLDDPNVVRLYEYIESPAGAAIVMELVDGVSLREITVGIPGPRPAGRPPPGAALADVPGGAPTSTPIRGGT